MEGQRFQTRDVAVHAFLLAALIALSPLQDLSAVPRAPGQLEVVVEVAGESPRAPVPAELYFIPAAVDSSSEPRQAIERQIEAPGRTAVHLAGARTWRIEVTAAGYWAPELVVTPEGRHEPLPVVLYPAANIRGRLEVSAGEGVPTSLEVSFKAAPKDEAGRSGVPGQPPSGRVSCPVSEAGWECEIPAGLLDLRLRAGGFVPVYLWGLEVKRGETRDLGSLRLRQGASISGWVETEEEARPLAGSEIRLFVETAGAPTDRSTLERLEGLDSVTRTNERGFFQLQGVAPGRYGLQVRHPGYAPTGLSPIEVQAGLESQVLEPILLGAPVSLEAVLFPALDPFGRLWTLDLFRQERGRFAQSFHGRASEEGVWSRNDLPPGNYRLRVSDEDGSRWARREVRLVGERVEEVIEIDLVEVRGELTLGDDPVAALLWFGGEHGARRVQLAADLEGRFEGFLPEEGRWPVEALLQRGEGQRLAVDPVEVRRRKGKGYAEVAIRIPDTLLQGEVVDEAGRPVSTATVEIRGDGRSSAVSDEAGRFEVRGLPEGQIIVYAESEDAVSDWTPLLLAEGETPPDLRLVLHRQQRIVGEVVSEGGPVPGARILALPDLATSPGATLVEAVTGPAGRFQLMLPASSPSATLIVAAPRFATRILRRATRSPEPWKILVDALGGTLVLPGPERAELGRRRTGLLFHGDTGVAALVLLRILPSEVKPDGSLALPNLEPGEYTLCPPGTGIAALRDDSKAPPEAECATGFLLPHTELALLAADQR